ncbi:MAG: hypothetical protein R3194_10705 [Limnobacter sp.]|nr:hypothetical protein [Limnobacter sp.]
MNTPRQNITQAQSPFNAQDSQESHRAQAGRRVVNLNQDNLARLFIPLLDESGPSSFRLAPRLQSQAAAQGELDSPQGLQVRQRVASPVSNPGRAAALPRLNGQQLSLALDRLHMPSLNDDGPPTGFNLRMRHSDGYSTPPRQFTRATPQPSNAFSDMMRAPMVNTPTGSLGEPSSTQSTPRAGNSEWFTADRYF